MRDKDTPAELEHRRLLAVQRVLEGYSTEEVADFLGVDPRSVRRWIAAFRHEGSAGLLAQPAVGPPDPAGVRPRAQPEGPHRLAPPSRRRAAEAGAPPASARPGGDRRLVGVPLA